MNCTVCIVCKNGKLPHKKESVNRRTDNTMAKRTNNDLQNITHKTKN